jgi:hypothetical protein
MENKQSLPLNINIVEWNAINNFKESFDRFPNVECFQDKDIERIENYLYSNVTIPTILLLRTNHVKELMKGHRRFIDIIFGLKNDSKLLELDVSNGANKIYLHGLWYLFLDDCRFSSLKILNNDEDLIFAGVNFNRENYMNPGYYMNWGSKYRNGQMYEQGVYLVKDGGISKTTGY